MAPLAMQPRAADSRLLRCAASAVAAVVEQLRLDPQALYSIQAQGQIPPHVYSSVLTECASRVAPVLHTAIAPIVQGQLAQQIPGSQFGQVPGQPFGQTQPYPQAMGLSPMSPYGI